ncbi:MAG TPA: hypothetical protein VN805_02205 [Caulobacteraceae bacterium]|nr:hypothetical protein [Caulobacteraceae bacterium]
MRGVFNIVFRIISTLLGVLVGLMGCIWILQGLGMASGRMAQSFMENDRMWAVWGVIALLVGIGQVVWSNTRQVKAA